MPKTKIDFQTFWNAYGLKRDRIAAERAWKRLSAKDQQAAYAGIPAYCEDCQRRGIAMMYAQGYINHRRWEDEIQPVESVAVAQQPSPTPGEPPKMEIW